VTRAAGLAGLLAVVLLVHWPPAGAEFSYDDTDFVSTNESLRSLEGAVRALLAPFPPGQPERALYRPLTNLSYALDHALYGERARGYHATNVALYAAVVLLVWRLALAWRLSPGAAYATALLFAAHPVHCEAVDSVSGRSELLSLLFACAALLLYLRAQRAPAGGGRGALLASAAAQALACLAKESAAVLPGVLLVHELAFGASPARGGRAAWLRSLRRLGPSLAVLAGYLALRGAVLGRFGPEHAPLAGSELATRAWTMGAVFLVYLRLLVFPDVLQLDFYYQALVGILRRPTLGSLLGWALVLGLLAAALRIGVRHLRRSGEGSPADAAALCAFAVFFGFLLPVSHVIDVGVLVGERLLFAPSLGFVALAVLAGERGLARVRAPAARRAVALGLVGALAAAGASRSTERAAEWRDAARLWLAVEPRVARDPRVPSNLAGVYLARGDLARAEAALERALALEPEAFYVRGNLGLLRIEQGRLEEAEAIFARIAAERPGDALAQASLARIQELRGR
jgi:tetratricopeptide (TPR) repeat protein